MSCLSKEDSQSSNLATFCHAEKAALRIALSFDFFFFLRSWKDGFLYEMFFSKTVWAKQNYLPAGFHLWAASL